MDTQFFIAAFICGVLVVISTTVFYEVLRLLWTFIPALRRKPRAFINIIVIAIFAGHTLCVWIYGIAYWLLVEFFAFGSIAGNVQNQFIEYIYFSVTTYSSLGFGDVFPEGPLRLIAGVEVLNGLVLIGWSVTFTYLVMQKLWDLHFKR